MSREIEANSEPLQECEVAIVGAGPVGLMTANLLGLAGIRVVVLERNKGLLGLPRAIAYDAETLRLFTQVGLFNEIAPGLIQNPHVRHLNARNVTLMAADFPVRSQFGHSALGTFYQPEFENILREAGVPKSMAVQIASVGYAKAIRSDSGGEEAKTHDVLTRLSAAVQAFSH